MQDLKQLDWRRDVAKIVKKNFDARKKHDPFTRARSRSWTWVVLRSGA